MHTEYLEKIIFTRRFTRLHDTKNTISHFCCLVRRKKIKGTNENVSLYFNKRLKRKKLHVFIKKFYSFFLTTVTNQLNKVAQNFNKFVLNTYILLDKICSDLITIIVHKSYNKNSFLLFFTLFALIFYRKNLSTLLSPIILNTVQKYLSMTCNILMCYCICQEQILQLGKKIQLIYSLKLFSNKQ